jgi:hypothetical protein
MPPKRATSMAPKATVPRMRPMLLLAAVSCNAQTRAAAFDSSPSAAGLAHACSTRYWFRVVGLMCCHSIQRRHSAVTRKCCAQSLRFLWSLSPGARSQHAALRLHRYQQGEVAPCTGV